MAIYAHLGPARRRQLAGTILLMVAGAFAEIATIGAVLPFLLVITPGSSSGRYAGLVTLVARLGAATGLGIVALSAGLLITIAIVSVAMRLVLSWVSQRFVFAVAHDLALQVYDRVLRQPYAFHVAHNSAETLAGIEKVQYVLGNVLLPAMLGGTAVVVAVAILGALILVDPATSLAACLCFVLLYAIVSAATRRRLYRNSDVIAAALQSRVQALQEGLGGIRDVLLDRSQPIFVAKFARLDERFRAAQATNQFIAIAPRYVVEGGGVVLIALLALLVSTRPGGVIGALPMLGALALGAQRLLPLVQQVYFSWSQIYGNRSVLDDVARLLEMPVEPPTAIATPPAFTHEIAFRDVTFAYAPDARPALRDVTLTIPKGARFGLVGKSGSGKSTFADLLMGLLEPTGGALAIDGRPFDAAAAAGWQAQIAHVPQAIFLSDGTIAANIAFGRDDIDGERVIAAARDAGLHDFIAALPQGYDTAVGERGIRLSGGQRQRIGIARALYKHAAVLVLDEATSALDDETERAVMDAIARLPRRLTVISIAHRVSTLRACDTIARLDEGRVIAIGSYDAVIGDSRIRM